MHGRVLIVDDDEACLSGMKQLVEMAGHEASSANTFEEGRRVLRKRRPRHADCRRAAGLVQRSSADRHERA